MSAAAFRAGLMANVNGMMRCIMLCVCGNVWRRGDHYNVGLMMVLVLVVGVMAMMAVFDGKTQKQLTISYIWPQETDFDRKPLPQKDELNF